MTGRPSRHSYFDLINNLELDDSIRSDSVNSDGLYSSLACTSVFNGHTGCVNALDWCEDGKTLTSGSDDCNLCLWSFPTRSLLATVPTGHTQNIFSVKYLPTTDNRIITASGDTLVKCVQIRDDGRPSVIRTWTGHHDRVKRIDTECFDPNTFLTASEDGSVREFDLRTNDESGNCLADWSNEGISLNSISISPLRPFLVAAAGTGPVIRFIDRRKPAESTKKERGLVWMPVHHNLEMVTAVKFSSYSMDLIASLINDNIHMINFESFESGGPLPESNLVIEERKLFGELSRKWARGEFENYYYAMSQLITKHRSLQFATIGDLCELLAVEIYNRMLCAVKIDQLEQAELDASYLIEGGTKDPKLLRLAYLIMYMQSSDSDDEERRKRFKSFLESVQFGDSPTPNTINTHEIIDPTSIEAWRRIESQKQVYTRSERVFKGHVNSHTVKDVCFAGPRHEYVASGSDGGYFFIWNRENSGCPHFIGSSDTQVVNVVVENPKMPAFAISGIDNDIKIWEPSLEERPVEELEWRAVPRNQYVAFMERLKRLTNDGLPILTVPCPVQ